MESAMEHDLFRRTSLEERLGDRAKLLREEAKLLPPGAVRDATIGAAGKPKSART